MLKMAATIAKPRVDYKMAQVRYKNGFDRRMRHGYAEIEEGDLFWMDVQDGM